MAKNDVVVRSAADLEKKYNFPALLGLKKNVEITTQGIQKIQNELNSMLNSLVINLKDVLDDQSEISLWFYSGIPTTSNEPYISWATPSDHIGDLYYDKSSGYVYQYKEVNGKGLWEINTNTDLIETMAITNAENDTSTDHERKVFFDTPTIPYTSGDWWIKEDGSLYICQISKTTGIYEEADFINANNYTSSFAEKIGEEIKVLKGTITMISENYAKFTDLATGGSTIISGDNILTGTIDAAKVKIANDNVVLDKDGIKLNNGAKVVGENGLMNTYLFGSTSERPFIGFIAAGYMAETAVEENILIEFAIPKGLEITKARVHLFHNPIFWRELSTDGGSSYTGTALGYSRKVKLYKATNLGTRKVAAAYGSSYADEDSTTYSDTGITWYDKNGNSLGSSFTPTTPTSSSYAMTEAVTSDFSNIFKTSGKTVPGTYQLKLATSESLVSSWSASDCAARTGRVYAILEVEGYMSYT